MSARAISPIRLYAALLDDTAELELFAVVATRYDHPLWWFENVTITPYNAEHSTAHWD